MRDPAASKESTGDAEIVRRAELRLLSEAGRASASEVEALLDDGFVEFGSSGRVFDKATTMAALAVETSTGPRVTREVSDFTTRFLGAHAILLTYRVVRCRLGAVPRASLRSSVWTRTPKGWRMLFHQGTASESDPLGAHIAAVAAGYDRMADLYLARYGQSAVRDGKLAEVVARLRPGGSVLDLGCGAGLPVAATLAASGFRVTGIDVSSAQVARAIRNVPDGCFLHADIATGAWPEGRFDAVLAFYVFNHLPRDAQAIVLARVAAGLEPGGVFVASFGVDEGDWSGEWLGVTMHFSHHAPETTRRLVEQAGLRIETAEVIRQDNEPTSFLWITARRDVKDEGETRPPAR